MSEGTLFVRDSRTSHEYEIPIHRNSVQASAFQQVIGPVAGSDPADKVGKGLRLFDPGFQHTASHETKITWVDGDKGVLLFRGHSIEQLWGSDFEDMVHLMVWETLPTPEQRETLRKDIASAACNIPESVVNAVQSFPASGPAMPMIIAGLAAYMSAEPTNIPAFMGGPIYHKNPEKIDKAIIRSLAAYSVVTGLASSHKAGTKFMRPSPDGTFYENLLTMAGHVDASTGGLNALHLSCLRRVGVLAVDHEVTNSTFAMLVTSSSLTDPLSALIGGLTAAYGPLHMGASESAYKTMRKIGSPSKVPALIESVKRGERRLFGYGHRMYRTVDPRIDLGRSILNELKVEANPVLAIAMEIDRIASTDEYFTKRKLYVNADLYITFYYIALGFPAELIPVMIFCQRLPGYMAHWREAMTRDIKLIRPAGFYTGPTEPLADLPSKVPVQVAEPSILPVHVVLPSKNEVEVTVSSEEVVEIVA